MGHARGELVLGGRKTREHLPRARTKAGEDVRLPSRELFSSKDPRSAHVVRRMLLGITTRGYGSGFEPMAQV
jgi:putative transposase